MKVIGIVGLPGSGKSEAAAVARDLDVPVVEMGEVIREECRDRGLDPAEHHGRVASALREEGGIDAIAERTLPVLREALAESDTVVVEGIRGIAEVERFEEAFGDDFVLVTVEAPRDVRAERIGERGRDLAADEGGEPLAERDRRELEEFGMADAMDAADVVVRNTGSLSAYRHAIEALLEEGVPAVRAALEDGVPVTPETEEPRAEEP